MGIGMLGGILSPLTDILMKLVEIIGETLFKFVIAPIIVIIGEILKVAISTWLYSIGRFILLLVDFIEMLFRSLAGLPTDGITMNFADGAGNIEGNSDLLLQLIRSDGVQTAFLSMCIVGLFLLIITTIFQMIKVEYTTEGAKNAKGPILEKAFKGLANLVMLPLLVVFGVFIGNQVLGLLDTATKGDSNYTISGMIFATAASDAFYHEGDLSVDASLDPIMGIIFNIGPIFQKSWQKVVNSFTTDTIEEEKPYRSDYRSEEQRENILDQYRSGDNTYTNRSYANLKKIVDDFDFTEINYIIMIVGGIFILKALYLACFGMISRLYTCAILFIISPAVIGMSPINEGNLGKWRGRFIGSCLSAYGVILSLNLFFIIVDVLLSIDIDFTTIGSYAAGNGLSSILMEGLFKTLLVLAGVTMIEKFSKELGSYFGAEDAISAGKELEGAMAAPVKAAVGVAAGAATMAVGAGALGAKMMSSKKVTGVKNELKQRNLDRSSAEQIADKKGLKGEDKNKFVDNYMDERIEQRKANKIADKEKAKNDKKESRSKYKDAKVELEAKDATFNAEINALDAFKERNEYKAKFGKTEEERAEGKRGLERVQKQKEKLTEKHQEETKDLHKIVDPVDTKKDEKKVALKTTLTDVSMIGVGTMANLAKGAVSDVNPSSMLGNVVKQVGGAKKDVGKLSPEFESANKDIDKKVGDTKEKMAESLVGSQIDSKNKSQQMILTNAIVQQMQVQDLRSETQAKDMVQQYNDIQNKEGAYAYMSDAQREKQSADLIKALDDMGAKVTVTANGDIKNMKFDSMQKIDYDAVKKAIAAGMASGIPAGRMADKIVEAIAADGTRSQREMDRIVEAINKIVNKIQ